MEWLRVNDKRYRVDTGVIIDTNTGDILSPTKAKNRLNQYEYKIEDLNNQLQSNDLKIQNQKLRDRLTDKDALLQKQIAVGQNLDKQLAEREKEIIDIKRTIKDLMDNERTKLGYNALKQCYEAIKWPNTP